jgi:hypothetical protein
MLGISGTAEKGGTDHVARLQKENQQLTKKVLLDFHEKF